MRNNLPAALLLTFLAFTPRVASADPGAEVRAVGADYLEWITRESLFLRLKQGLPIERLPTVSLAHTEGRAREAQALLARLDAVPEKGLALEDLLSRETLRRRLVFDVEAPRHYWLGFDVTPYASPFGEVHAALRAVPLRTKVDRDRFLGLVGSYPAFVSDLRTRLRGQAERGIRLPKDELPLVRAFLEGGLDPGPASPFAVGEARLQGVSPAEAAAFKEAVAARADEARKAIQALQGDLGGAYAAAAPEGVGLSQYPGGREAYEALVRLHTTLDITPEEVHRIGLEEVARIEARMADVRAKLGFKGNAAQFREAVKKDPRLLAKTPDEVGAKLLAYAARIEPKVDAFFLHRPQAPYGVKRLEAEREPALTFGIYEPPTPAEPRGLYRFNGSKLEERSLLTAGPLTYHELVPGHHFQIALADENKALPAFRRELWDTAYAEGWGDYSAAVAEEMGMYEDPYDTYGRLAMDMFISVRLVVDTGMNALSWPRDQAVTYMREHLMESDTQIGTESLRYSVDIPGQALAYKMGSRGIQDLRKKAETALGARFDVRRFHDCILGSGSLPLAALAQKVDAFIAESR